MQSYNGQQKCSLQTHLATQQPNYPDNAESILEMLFDAYNESSGFDNAAIEAESEKQSD